MPFSAATIWEVFSEITHQNADSTGYHLEKHLEKIVVKVRIKNAVSPATTCEMNNQPFSCDTKLPKKPGQKIC